MKLLYYDQTPRSGRSQSRGRKHGSVARFPPVLKGPQSTRHGNAGVEMARGGSRIAWEPPRKAQSHGLRHCPHFCHHHLTLLNVTECRTLAGKTCPARYL
jgi:hypothetical protein